MLRRLIACLALLSGLFAASAPAQAAYFDAAVAQLEAVQKTDAAGKGQASPCGPREAVPGLAMRKTLPCKPAPTITITIPTVMLGVDRAAE